jgi:HK97 family phage portal protein
MASLASEFRDFVGAIISFPQDFFGVFGLPPSESGSIVNEMSALQVAAYFSCVRVISDAVGTLPLNIYERMPDGGEKLATDHPLFNILHLQPNPESCAADVRQAAQSHCLMTGNAYIEIDWSKGGQVLGLYLRSPFSTFPYRNNAGELIYKTHDNPNGQERWVAAEDMVHVKGLGIDSLIGLSPIKYYAREVLGTDIAAQSYSAKFFANNANPGGYLSAPGNLTPTQKLDNMRTWIDAHGKGNNHKPAVLEAGWKWEQTSIDPTDAMLIQTRELNRSQICAIFGVPEHMAGGKEESKANMEQKALEFLTFTLKPWLHKWQQAINSKLFPSLGRTAGKFFAKFDTAELERADYATMIKGIQMARYAGLMSIQEGRKALKLNPYDQKQLDSDNPADKLWMPVNMIVVSDEEPEVGPNEVPGDGPQNKPAPSGGIGGNAEPSPGQKPTQMKSQARTFTLFYSTFRDAFGRILKRKKPNEADFRKIFMPVMSSIAGSYELSSYEEPGNMAISEPHAQILRDYIDTMCMRSTEWNAKEADTLAADELKRAIAFIQSKVEEPQDAE